METPTITRPPRRPGGLILLLGMLAFGALGCRDRGHLLPEPAPPSFAITPGWTTPAPPNTLVGQSYDAAITGGTGTAYLWSVGAGSATLVHATTATVTFTPTASGAITLQCAVTGSDSKVTNLAYQVTATQPPPSFAITPGWTTPAPPNTLVGQNYDAAITGGTGTAYLWSVGAGSATLINATTATVTFTPTASGAITLQCAVTGSDSTVTNLAYQVTATQPAPSFAITPGWTLPVPPSANVGQSYDASITGGTGTAYLWSIGAGSATLLNAATATVTFTPTASGAITLQCAVTGSDSTVTNLSYQVTASVGATLNAEPATISTGQGTLLLATFTGASGVITPGNLSVTSGLGVPVKPTSTTTYTLTVDGTAVATSKVEVKAFVPKFVYVSNGSAIAAFALNTATGALAAVTGSPYSGLTPDQVLPSPDGKYLYAAGYNKGVYGFSIDPGTGALTPMSGSPFPAATVTSGVLNLAVDPYQRFLYTNGRAGAVYAYTIDHATGALTAVAGSPYTTASNERGGVLVHPSGKYLYAVASGTAKVFGYSIDQTTGALTAVAGSPFDASGGGLVIKPYGVAVDSTGAYLFAKGEEAAADQNYMAGFKVDVATGVLTAMASSPIGPFPGRDAYRGLCFHPTLDVLYTAFYDSTTSDAGAFSLDLATGALAPMTGSPFNLFTSHGSDNITVDRSGQFAYSVGYAVDKVAQMRADGSGGLTRLDGTALGVQNVDTITVPARPICVTVAGSLENVP